jgi:tetratricopeptide (TPR) repeat protein
VALYNETDYRAALVEFKRAYEVAPNAAVLYNIGQTYYQLQNYASALTTLDRYLAEAGTTAPHRREVEQTIEILQARVGKIAVTTNVPDCEVTIDDELVGKTPLSEPVLVSIGHRKITTMHEGRTAETRFVDVAAGDTVKLTFSLVDPTAAAAPGAVDSGGWSSERWLKVGWYTTGTLGVATVASGAFAYLASRDLSDARGKLGTTRAQLDQKGSRVTTLSAVADVLGVATLVVGGLTLRYSLSHGKSTEVHVAVAPTGVQLAGSFH